MSHIKIIPILIFVAVIAFSFRLSHVVVDARDVYFEFKGQIAFAADELETDAVAKHDDTDEKLSADGHDAEGEVNNEEEVSSEESNSLVWRDSVEDDYDYEATRNDYSKDLEVRSDKLKAKENTLRAQEALLKAAQQEMKRKFVELSQLRKQLEILLGEQQDQEQQQIVHLVEIYEGMKAKEAARIFNSLDIDVLINVLMKMSNRKAAAILAKMNPERAKAVTVMLAEQKTLPSL